MKLAPEVVYFVEDLLRDCLLENEIAFFWIPPSPLQIRGSWGSKRVRGGGWLGLPWPFSVTISHC